MELTHSRTVKILAVLLFLAAISQPIYTALYLNAPSVDRQFVWAFEAIVFVLLAAFAGSALVTTKRYTLGFSAIAFSAVLNVVQIGVGLTQFGPFREAAQLNPDLGVAASSVVAFSFFGYNAAKILLGLAAVVFGMAFLSKKNTGLKKTLGSATVLVGTVAFFANSVVMMFGRAAFVPSPLAGGSGVLATLLLAVCLISLRHDD